MSTAAILLGRSPAHLQFMEHLRLAAGSDATVLLEGESGVGKSTAGLWLHAEGARAAKPCLSAHLGALSSSLIESELFGHAEGAFTDAGGARKGLFRRADGGTLVLDDIGLLPLESQVKLLRVLQERVVEPVGSEESFPVDVRIVATAARGLEARVRAGGFREDLYYRLAVVTLEVPPLRAREGDLERLSEGLLERAAERYGRVPARRLSAAALELCRAHAWPGNVRELENAMERVTALGGPEDEVAPAELEFLEESVAGIEVELADQALAHGVGLEDFERALLQAALAQARGNLSAAARAVGLTRRAFEYRVERQKTPDDKAGEGRETNA